MLRQYFRRHQSRQKFPHDFTSRFLCANNHRGSPRVPLRTGSAPSTLPSSSSSSNSRIPIPSINHPHAREIQCGRPADCLAVRPRTPDAGGAVRRRPLRISALDRQNCDDFHVVLIDDNDLVLIDEIEKSAPFRFNPYKHLAPPPRGCLREGLSLPHAHRN